MKDGTYQLNYSFVIYPILFLLLGVLFFLLQPKLATTFVPGSSENRLENFITESKSGKGISGQEYWEFREFYSPGYFTFNKTGLTSGQMDKELKQILKKIDSTSPILAFHSESLQSIDSLTTIPSIKSVKNAILFSGFKTIYEGKDQMIIEYSKKLYFFLLFSNEELQKTNGFLDYSENDRELTSNKKWLSISVIENKVK